MLKVFVSLLAALLFIVLVIIQLWLQATNSLLLISNFVYWLILFAWIALIKLYKFESGLLMAIAFALILTSLILAIIGLPSIGETIIRISFIGWLVGIVQALLEYRKEHG